jgi:hypothetical protein
MLGNKCIFKYTKNVNGKKDIVGYDIWLEKRGELSKAELIYYRFAIDTLRIHLFKSIIYYDSLLC